MLQQFLVMALVGIATLYVVWTLSGNPLRRRVLRVLQRVVELGLRNAASPLAVRLSRAQRRLDAGAGCSACRSTKP